MSLKSYYGFRDVGEGWEIMGLGDKMIRQSMGMKIMDAAGPGENGWWKDAEISVSYLIWCLDCHFLNIKS